MNGEIIKPQWIRLLDVFVLGPYLIYVVITNKSLTGFAKVALVTAGAATIVYNGNNYLKIRAKERASNGG